MYKEVVDDVLDLSKLELEKMLGKEVDMLDPNIWCFALGWVMALVDKDVLAESIESRKQRFS